jgi:hypothetical protein
LPGIQNNDLDALGAEVKRGGKAGYPGPDNRHIRLQGSAEEGRRRRR